MRSTPAGGEGGGDGGVAAGIRRGRRGIRETSESESDMARPAGWDGDARSAERECKKHERKDIGKPTMAVGKHWSVERCSKDYSWYNVNKAGFVIWDKEDLRSNEDDWKRRM